MTEQVVFKAFGGLCFPQFDTKFATQTAKISQDWDHFRIFDVVCYKQMLFFTDM